MEKRLKILSFTLPLDKALPVLADEGDVAVYCENSPDGKHIVVFAGNHDQNDFWLLQRDKKTQPVKLIVSAGRNVGAKWYGNKYFGISWGGMGYSSLALYRISNLSTHCTIDNLISFLPEKELYVAGSLGADRKFYIDLGVAFSNVETDRFLLPLEVGDPASALENIVGAKVVKHELIVEYLQKGIIRRKSFDSDLLKRIGAAKL